MSGGCGFEKEGRGGERERAAKVQEMDFKREYRERERERVCVEETPREYRESIEREYRERVSRVSRERERASKESEVRRAEE